MDNRRAVTLSILAALGAVFFCWLYLRKAVDLQVGDLKKRILILKATRTIPANVRIDETMVTGIDYPEAYAPPKAATSLEQVLGQVAIATIFEGEPILTSKIVPFDESSLDRRIPEGFRALTIGIRDDQDVVGVGGMIRPGQFVDILVTLYVSTRDIEKGPTAAIGTADALGLKAETRTIFQNVRVLAVGRDARISSARVNRPDDLPEDLANKNVTVAMKPDEVQKLVLAQSTGRLTLSLRRFNDTEVVALDYLDPFRAFGIRLPIVSGPAPAYREIRGGQVFAVPN